MRLKCLVCKHEFETSERFVVLQAWVKHTQGSGQGIQLAVCQKHLSQEITEALLLHTSGWTAHTNQVYAEHLVFGD